MPDPRNSSAPYTPDIDDLGSGQFDDSIFEKVALTPEDQSPEGDEDLDLEEPPSQREGLPPGFRMRHDAHYVEELVSRNRASRVVALATPDTAEPRNGERVGVPIATETVTLSQACSEIGQALDAIGACLGLFSDTPRPAPEQVALDLINAEVCRASWYVQALSLVQQECSVANVPVALPPLVARVVRTLAPGWERQGSTLVVEAEPAAACARGDESLLAMAIAGMVQALQAVTDRVAGARITAAVRPADDGLLVEVSTDAVTIPASWRTRFLDPDWAADRPGGRRVAVALAASRRVAELHRGALTLADTDEAGCRLVLSVPRA